VREGRPNEHLTGSSAARPARRAGRRGRSAAVAVWLLLAGGASAAFAPAPEGALTLSAAERGAIVQALAADPDFEDGPPAAMSDPVLWSSLLRHATLELGQRMRPTEIDPLWALAPAPRPVAADAQAARDAGRLGPWILGLGPSDPRYRALQGARRRYREIVEAGGWAATPAAAAGHAPPASALSALRARLAAEGYLPAGEARPGVPERPLKPALAEFQAHHALTPDGVVGAQTLAALNVTAEARLAQIDANLERWRWLPRLPRTRVEVDVGGPAATLFVEDAPRLAMRVIVGDLSHRTPLFASRLESVVFNPPWNVPASIAEHELLPRERAQPGYLARNDFIRVAGALQQRPGPLNALGRLKFDFPSPFGVYLHDTPARAAFGLANRWRSHGCVRLEDPRGLAAAVLGPQGWTPAKVDAAIAAGATSRVALAQPVPLYVAYWTVVGAADGAPLFRPDPYGWDDKLMQALARRGGGGGGLAAARADSECSAAHAPQPLP